MLQHAKRVKPAAVSWGSKALELLELLPADLKHTYTDRIAPAWHSIITAQY